MQITVGNLKEKILETYYTKGIKPQIVSDVKNVKAKPCLAYRISDILDIKDSTLSVKDSSASALDGDFVINENSIFVLNFFNNKRINSAMYEFKSEDLIEFFTSISDFDRYKICDKNGCYLEDEILDEVKQTKETYNKNIADKDLIFTLRSKPSTERGYDTDYFIKVENQEGKQVANCTFNIKNKKYANLGWIEIEDKDYVKIGLGSEMLKMVEDIAKNAGIFSLNARIQPFGEFSYRTIDFYKKNGFEVEFDPCDRKVYGTKKIQKMENCDEAELE